MAQAPLIRKSGLLEKTNSRLNRPEKGYPDDVLSVRLKGQPAFVGRCGGSHWYNFCKDLDL